MSVSLAAVLTTEKCSAHSVLQLAGAWWTWCFATHFGKFFDGCLPDMAPQTCVFSRARWSASGVKPSSAMSATLLVLLFLLLPVKALSTALAIAQPLEWPTM